MLVESSAVNFQRRKACGAHPLTVCYGTSRWRITNKRLCEARKRAAEPLLRRTDSYVQIGGDGCGRVIAWSPTRPSQVRCAECRDARRITRSHAALEARAAAHAAGRFDYLYWRDDGSTFRAYEGLCSKCGEEFADERSHVTTCDACRKRT